MPLAVLLSPHFLPACFVAFVSLRLLSVVCLDTTPTSDAAWYFERAIGLADGAGYSEGGLPTAFWPIGYPAILSAVFAAFGSKVIVGQFANIAFGGASFVGVYLLAKRFTQDEAVGRAAVLALTVYPNHVAYTNLLLTEVVYTSLLLWAFILATGRPLLWYWIASGFLFGLAALTKTQTLVFPIFMFCFLFLVEGTRIKQMKAATWVRQYLFRIVIVNATMFMVVAPWTWRNYQVFDAFVPISTNGGITLLIGNNPNATGDYLSPDMLPAGYITVPHEERVARQVERDQQAGRRALRWIKEDWRAFLMLMPRKLARLWIPDGEAEWGFQAGYAEYEAYRLLFRAGRYVNQAFYFAVLALSMFATNAVIARRLPLKLLECWTVPLFTTFLSILFIGQPRFHFISMPYLLILAAAGLSQFGFNRGAQGGGNRQL